MNPDVLLEHAFRLANAPGVGAPRQVDLRRAISAGYYAIFHELCRLIADQLVGTSRRTSAHYQRCYRTLPHSRIPAAQSLYVQAGGASTPVITFCNMAKILQTERHLADYDPHYRTTRQDALLALTATEQEIRSLRRVSGDEKLRLATVLVFSTR